jgi:hypothetical protein
MMTNLIDSGIEAAPLQNAHPNIDLARATQRLLDLKKATNNTRFSRDELVSSLGFSPTSGAATPVISALIHFGFLQRANTDYIYTELANSLSLASADSSEYRVLIKQALSAPEMYEWLNNKYGDQLPDEINDILIGKYHDRHVTNKNVKEVVNNYLKSVAFANKTHTPKEGELELGEYISVSFRGNTVSIYKKYLLEAIERTQEYELAKISESLV